jgi:hypothetical protein
VAIGGGRGREGGPQAARARAHGEDRRVLYGGARPAPPPPRGLDGDRLAAALHVTNGDSAAGGLQAAGPAWRVLAWRDALHEGPVPAVPEAALRRRRAAVLGAADPAAQAALLGSLAARDATLARGRAGAYVLWFEADLYDQLQLVQVLARLGELGVPPTRITLVCVGEHLGFAHFGGLGELTPAQLHALPATAAAALSPAAVDLAARAWAAFRAPHPAGLGAIAAAPSPELRFVAEAFDRLSREYPSTRDGLSLTERRILAATAAGGSPAAAVFRQIWAREARPYLGDHFCWRILARLVRARTPLLELEAGSPDAPIAAATRLRRTAAGERVLRGEADHVALSGLDRWIGGVHLSGTTTRWRWDEGTESIV